MANDTTTKWTVSVSKDTDSSVRSLLAQRGAKRGDLSKFVEDAVKWRVFDQTIAQARSGFSDMPADELEALVAEAVAAARRSAASQAG